jgi:hypothetical protein
LIMIIATDAGPVTDKIGSNELQGGLEKDNNVDNEDSFLSDRMTAMDDIRGGGVCPGMTSFERMSSLG